MKQQKGITLLELIIAITIVAIISMLAIPNFSHFIHQSKADTYLTRVAQAIDYAKHQARRLNSPVTVCPMERNECIDTKDWSLGFVIFIDVDKSGKLKVEKDILKKMPGPGKQASLFWNGFQDYLSVAADGSLLHQNGSFVYQSKVKKLYDRKLVISNSGRVREG